MPRCENCQSSVLDGAIVCPVCDQPPKKVKDRLLAAYAAADELNLQSFGIICPHCKKGTSVVSASDGWLDVTCAHCAKGFRTLLATVRAKRSRGNRQSGNREYDVRVKLSDGSEELIQYSQNSYDDFDLRGGDLAGFSCIGSDLIVTQNLTTGRYTAVAHTWSDIFEMIKGLLVLAVIVALAFKIFS